MKLLGHTSYLGFTGYNAFARGFFRELYKKNPDLYIRNFTVCDKKNEYLNSIDKSILREQSLFNSNGLLQDFQYENEKFIPRSETDINIILNETNHTYFYQNYIGKKIAYNVWESTKQPSNFFNQLKSFDQVWVPTEWQKSCLINQGYSSDKIFVVNIGTESDCFVSDPDPKYITEKFKIIMVGAWCFRKSTKDLIQNFIDLFKNNNNVELHLFVDNKFLNDGNKSTHERLHKYNLNANNIIVHSFSSREYFLNHLKSSHLFLSCARAEGWNIPLAEALACGIPSIFSKCSGQLEFIPNHINTGVDIVSEIPAICEEENVKFEGNYYLPDFDQCKQIIKNVYENYDTYKQLFLKYSSSVSSQFKWENSATQAINALQLIKNNPVKKSNNTNTLHINFNEGASVEILGNNFHKYNIKFKNKNEIIHEDTISNNMWTKTNVKYLLPYTIEITELDSKLKMNYQFDLKNKYVKIINESPSLGDNIAWISVVDKFQKTHECELHYYTPLKDIYENQYPNIKFYDYNHNSDIKYHATYQIGCFEDTYKSPKHFRSENLQNVAATILNLNWNYKNESVPKLNVKYKEKPLKEKYVCISTASTSGCKHWQNKDGWQQTVDYINSLGYKVVVIQKEPLNYMGNSLLENVLHPVIVDLHDAIKWLNHCEFYVGLGSGFSWVSWALNKKVVLISGFSEPYSEFYTPYRVINKSVCHGCWNNINHEFDRSNWNWCPENKNFECSKNITFDMVKEKINELLKNI